MTTEINATFIIVMAFCFSVTQFSCLFEAVFFYICGYCFFNMSGPFCQIKYQQHASVLFSTIQQQHKLQLLTDCKVEFTVLSYHMFSIQYMQL